ncbi:hypothetical protein AUJ83_00585 [Candidatus Woesearchaeota archaeon CG1_02_33_12]|nr:MAG: hypothetical protein AUJ83_00585 [Candidatus Woesearchaeota archaeon CG1_02_33_12]
MKAKWIDFDMELVTEDEFEIDGITGKFGIRIIDWEEALSNNEYNDYIKSHKKYMFSLEWIPEILGNELKKVMESCDMGEPYLSTMSYGLSISIIEIETNNYSEGLCQIKVLPDDFEEKVCEAYDKPVNRIGQTGKEFLSGDNTSCIQRGLDNKDMNAWLMARIHGASEKDLNSVGYKFDDFKK